MNHCHQTSSFNSNAMRFSERLLYSICISQLTLALIAGNAMAGERADRSAEFIAYLPLEKRRLLMSKLAIGLLALVAIWGINSLIFGVNFVVANYYPNAGFQLDSVQQEYFYKQLPWVVTHIALTGLTFFGVAWLISSFQSSTTFAVAGGLVTPLVTIMTINGIALLLDLQYVDAEQFVSFAYATSTAILATVCFGIGTVLYLKRREP